jgi:hypothetical protein
MSVMERRELLERLAPPIPPPRAHQVRYHGILAPCASGRDRVVPARMNRNDGAETLYETRECGPPIDAGPATPFDRIEKGLDDGCRPNLMAVRAAAPIDWSPGSIAPAPLSEARVLLAARVDPMDSRPRRTDWADLLQRVFEVDALRCPSCGGRMRVLSAVTDPHVARRILECLRMPPRAPPLTPASKRESEIDDALDMGWSNRSIDQLDPGFEFDQSVPERGEFARPDIYFTEYLLSVVPKTGLVLPKSHFSPSSNRVIAEVLARSL